MNAQNVKLRFEGKGKQDFDIRSEKSIVKLLNDELSSQFSTQSTKKLSSQFHFIKTQFELKISELKPLKSQRNFVIVVLKAFIIELILLKVYAH